MWIGGETEALIRLERYLERKAYIASFGRRPDKTSHILLSSQTDLSPYLRFGCLSSRLFHHEFRLIYVKVTQSNICYNSGVVVNNVLAGNMLWL